MAGKRIFAKRELVLFGRVAIMVIGPYFEFDALQTIFHGCNANGLIHVVHEYNN